MKCIRENVKCVRGCKDKVHEVKRKILILMQNRNVSTGGVMKIFREEVCVYWKGR